MPGHISHRRNTIYEEYDPVTFPIMNLNGSENSNSIPRRRKRAIHAGLWHRALFASPNESLPAAAAPPPPMPTFDFSQRPSASMIPVYTAGRSSTRLCYRDSDSHEDLNEAFAQDSFDTPHQSPTSTNGSPTINLSTTNIPTVSPSLYQWI